MYETHLTMLKYPPQIWVNFEIRTDWSKLCTVGACKILGMKRGCATLPTTLCYLPHCSQWEKMLLLILRLNLISAYAHCLPLGTTVIMHSNNGSVHFYFSPVLGNHLVSVGTRSSCTQIQTFHDIVFYKNSFSTLLLKKQKSLKHCWTYTRKRKVPEVAKCKSEEGNQLKSQLSYCTTKCQ